MGLLAVACVLAGVLPVGLPGSGAQAAPTAGPVQRGRATMNSLGDSGLGNCSFPPEVIADRMYTAAPPGDYDSSGGCGSYLDVTGSTGRTVRVLIVDKCPECEPGHLDMSPESFRAIAPAPGGVQQITYTAVRDPALPGPVGVRVQTGSSAYWIGFMVTNHGNPLSAVEYRDADGGWHALTRTVYNYWHKEDGAGPGPFTLRLTDVYGRQTVVDGIELTPDVTQRTGVWMYEGGASSSASSPATSTGTSTGASTGTTGTTGTTSVTTSTGIAATCSATVDMAGSWPDGYQANLTIRNDTASPVRPWQVSWTVPVGITVTGWNGTFTREGDQVTVTAPEWNDTVAPGASISIGYMGVGAPTPASTRIQLNGSVCAEGLT